MNQLEARAIKIKRFRSIWSTLNFISSWVIPGISGIGIGIGIPAIYDQPNQIEAAFLVTGLVSLLYQVTWRSRNWIAKR